MKYILAPTVLLAIALALLGPLCTSARNRSPDGLPSRAEILRKLKGCARRPITNGCTEDTAQSVIEIYELGDHSVLGPLLQAGLTSDGALSETLGTFYAKVLWKDPVEFLGAIRSRPMKHQRQLSYLAGATDGGGMAPHMLADVKRSLQKISSQRDTLSSVAGICLAEVKRVNAPKLP